MTNAQTNMLVLKDNTGDYFLLPSATLEQGRVPEEHKAEIDQLIAEQQSDVHGHFWPVIFAIAEIASALTGPAVVATGTYLVVKEVTK
jgi:hypothetical protein